MNSLDDDEVLDDGLDDELIVDEPLRGGSGQDPLGSNAAGGDDMMIGDDGVVGSNEFFNAAADDVAADDVAADQGVAAHDADDDDDDVFDDDEELEEDDGGRRNPLRAIGALFVGGVGIALRGVKRCTQAVSGALRPSEFIVLAAGTTFLGWLIYAGFVNPPADPTIQPEEVAEVELTPIEGEIESLPDQANASFIDDAQSPWVLTPQAPQEATLQAPQEATLQAPQEATLQAAGGW